MYMYKPFIVRSQGQKPSFGCLSYFVGMSVGMLGFTQPLCQNVFYVCFAMILFMTIHRVTTLFGSLEEVTKTKRESQTTDSLEFHMKIRKVPNFT